MRFEVVGPRAMVEPAKAIGNLLRPGTVVFFTGGIGAGKTTLVRALLKHLGWSGKVTSPTFTIVSSYEISNQRIYHLDLYRLTEQQIGTGFLSEYFDSSAITLVEWPEKLPSELHDQPHIHVRIFPTKDGKGRTIEVEE